MAGTFPHAGGFRNARCGKSQTQGRLRRLNSWVSLWFTFSAIHLRGSLRSDGVWGTAMDSAAFQQLIALARDTAAELAATEKKVSAFKDELAHQDHRAQLNAAPLCLVR
jgi:hypothetical protein